MPRLTERLASALLAGLALVPPAGADEAMALARLVAERPANEGRVGTMHFRMESQSGSARERQALMIHSDTGEAERIAIFFTAPAMIEETAFLSFNHETRADENWLYLPATARVRRLPVSERGDYFMGTDLTYGDIKDNFKFGLDEWDFTAAGEETADGRTYPVLEGMARDAGTARELGYGSFRARIDPVTAFPVWIAYTDPDGDPLKQVAVTEIETVGEAWTAMRFTARNLQTGHTTDVWFTDMRHVPDLDDSVFDPDALAYGIPDVG